MNKIAPILSTLAAITVCVVQGEETPKGWFHAGNRPNDYKMSVDRQIVHRGKASASLQSTVQETSGFGTLMQTFKAEAYRGKRVRMSGYVRAKAVSDWAGLWMRVDGPKSEPLAFDNMQERPVKGDANWTRYEIVLDVPDHATEIAFGLLLTGNGQVWMDDLKFEVVGNDVPTTGNRLDKETVSAPVNLDFEE
jgi:hypothetical protein